MDKKRYIKVKWENFLKWRRLHISDKQTMGILSFFVGVGCAPAAFLLKFLIKTIHSFVNQGFTGGNLNYLYLITPIIGIAIASAFVHYVIKDDISHGVTKIMFAISQRKAYIRMHNMWSSVVASSFTIGFGGSGRSGGANCADGVGHRFPAGQSAASRPEENDAAGGLRCHRCRGGHLQGPHHGRHLHAGGPDARPYHGVHRAAHHHRHHRHRHHLLHYRAQRICSHLTPPSTSLPKERLTTSCWASCADSCHSTL